MPDPTTLRDAAAMVAADARDETVEDRAHCRISLEAIRTLRAALDAEDAWRARAEAAIAWVEGHKACDAALRNYSPDSQTYKDAVGRAEKAWAAARRRYEETAARLAAAEAGTGSGTVASGSDPR